MSSAAVADALDVPVRELRAALRSGRSLVQLAESKGLSRADLVDRLVARVQSRLAADVETGRLTRAQADEASARARERVSARVDQFGGAAHGPKSRGRGPR